MRYHKRGLCILRNDLLADRSGLAHCDRGAEPQSFARIIIMSKLLIALAAFAATPALAETIETPPVAHVRFSDLDLTTPSGKAALNRRIVHAVEQVCPDTSIQTLSRRSPSYPCRREAFKAVAAQRAQALARAAGNFPAGAPQTAQTISADR
jgi:UrcA family protein